MAVGYSSPWPSITIVILLHPRVLCSVSSCTFLPRQGWMSYINARRGGIGDNECGLFCLASCHQFDVHVSFMCHHHLSSAVGLYVALFFHAPVFVESHLTWLHIDNLHACL